MSQEKRTKINGLDSSSHSKRNKNKIPNNKTIDYTTTHYKYYNGKHRKFNEEEFQKQLKHFNDWENKKNEKIKKMKMDLEKKELKNYNKKNLHYNKHLSNYDQIKVIERLYKEDIKKRKEKKQTLLKVYECSFQPNLYYGSNNTNKNNQNRMMNTKSSRNFDKNNFMTYNNLVNRSLVLKNRKSNNNFNEIGFSSSTKHSKRKRYIDSDKENSISEEKDEQEIIADKLRARLFSNRKKTKRRINHSVEGRKKLKVKI